MMNLDRECCKKVTWRGLNKNLSGEIVGQHPLGYLVKLDNGKYVIVHPESIIETD